MIIKIYDNNMLECSQGGFCNPFYLNDHNRICSNCPLISFIEDNAGDIISYLLPQQL